MIYNISTQIFLLKQIDFGIIQFDIDDIIVMMMVKILFANPSKMTKIKHKNQKIEKIIKGKFIT